MISSFITQGQEDWWKKQQKQQQQQQTPYDYSSFVQQPVQQQPIDFSTILGSTTPTGQTGQTEQNYSPEWNNWLINTQNQATQVSYTPFIGSRGRFL